VTVSSPGFDRWARNSPLAAERVRQIEVARLREGAERSEAPSRRRGCRTELRKCAPQGKNPRGDALFPIDGGFGCSEYKNGGVCSQIRTGLDPELPDNWLFAGNFREFLPVIGKRTGIRCIDSITCKQIP